MSPEVAEELFVELDEDYEYELFKNNSNPKILEKDFAKTPDKVNSCRFCAGSKFC